MRTLLLLSLVVSSAGAHVLRVAESTAQQIRALNRDKAVVLLPAGVLEQHDPELLLELPDWRLLWVRRKLSL